MIGPPAAFAALALLIDSTMFWRIQEHFGNDLPAGVFSTAALALLMGERRFSRFYAWPVLGALLGIALLCKPTAGIFIGPAAVFVFATQMVAAIKNGRWRSVAQIVVGAAVAVGLALWIWSAAYPNFPWELGKLFHQVHAEATTAAKPFLDVNNRTLPADWARALGGARVALLIVGALLAPWALRRPGRRVWLAAFYPTLLYFIRSPQSSSQYMYTMLIVPLWAVTAVAASNARRPWREALVLAIGLVALLSKPGGYHVTAPKDNLGRVPRALTALGERLAGEIDRAPRDGDLFFVNRCALDTAAWDFFLLLPLGDSPHVRFIYFYDARDYADDEAFDRRIRLRSERITYLLSCGGGGATSEFTDAVREARAKMNRHPGEAPWPDQWPRFADVKPETLVTRIGRDKQTWRFWQASSE